MQLAVCAGCGKKMCSEAFLPVVNGRLFEYRLISSFFIGRSAMKTTALVGIAAMGILAAGVSSATATPVLQVTVGSNAPVNETATSLGSGTYYFSASTSGTFTWGGVLAFVNAATNQFTLALSPVATTSTGTISFVAQEVITDPNALSIQASGATTATDATSNQTVDFNSAVISNIPSSLGSEDSGMLGLNSAMSPTSPSSSIAYNSNGVNLAAFSGPLTVQNTITLSLNSAASLNVGSLTTNISNTSVPTPEPATLALFAVGGLALLAAGRRNKKRA
jgi:hypothetical protein